jgi:hypothetical protein
MGNRGLGPRARGSLAYEVALRGKPNSGDDGEAASAILERRVKVDYMVARAGLNSDCVPRHPPAEPAEPEKEQPPPQGAPVADADDSTTAQGIVEWD